MLNMHAGRDPGLGLTISRMSLSKSDRCMSEALVSSTSSAVSSSNSLERRKESISSERQVQVPSSSRFRGRSKSVSSSKPQKETIKLRLKGGEAGLQELHMLREKHRSMVEDTIQMVTKRRRSLSDSGATTTDKVPTERYLTKETEAGSSRSRDVSGSQLLRLRLRGLSDECQEQEPPYDDDGVLRHQQQRKPHLYERRKYSNDTDFDSEISVEYLQTRRRSNTDPEENVASLRRLKTNSPLQKRRTYSESNISTHLCCYDFKHGCCVRNQSDFLNKYGKSFTRARTFSGSSTQFDFPSPMHAVLLQTESAVAVTTEDDDGDNALT